MNVLNLRELRFRVEDLFVYILFAPLFFIYSGFEVSAPLYLVIPLFFIIDVYVRKNLDRQIDRNLAKSLLMYLLMILISVIVSINDLHFKVLIRDVIIISSPLLLFSYYGLTFDTKHIICLFLVSFLGFCFKVEIWNANTTGIFSLNILSSRWGSDIEYHAGSFLGSFFLFFFFKRKFLWAIAALLFVLAAGKRSILLGIFPSFLIYLIVGNTVKRNTNFRLVLMSVYFFSCYFVGVYIVDIAIFLFDFLNIKDIPVKAFLMGRENVFITLKPLLYSDGILNSLFGHGPGQADIYLTLHKSVSWYKVYPEGTNPHNDFLKLQYDYGLVGILGFFCILTWLYNSKKFGFLMFLYTVPILIVDNSLIFIYHQIVLGIISRCRYESKESFN